MIMRDYVCGKCGEEFSSNEADADMQCPECDAVLCEYCARWTGGPRW